VLARVLAVIALVCLNGFFVGAEFSLVRSRRTRLEARASEGDRLAGLALRGTFNISALLSASQLGVTLASLGLGWVAQSALAGLVADALARLPWVIEVSLRLTIGGAVALAFVTYLHVVFGELAPKGAALLHPETLARWLVPPLMAWAWLTTPITALLNRSAQTVLRTRGKSGADAAYDSTHSPEELRLLVEQAEEGGTLEGHDAAMINAVFKFSEKSAREVMTPRTDIIALPSDATLDETLAIVLDGGFSRYPVYADTIDNIVGILLAKDLITIGERRADFTPAAIMRPAHVIPGSRRVEDVLADFKRLKDHMAIVVDEYGGTAGIVTMEDLLEEIVGEILDEYDEALAPPLTPAHEGEVFVAGSTNIGELNSRYELTVPEEVYTTIGGYVFGALGRLPAIGDRITAGGATFTVRQMDGRRVETLSMEISATDATAPPSPDVGTAPAAAHPERPRVSP
jgi:CBS domain containing-hemolysin-like protein